MAKKTIDERFKEFHANNPIVYDTLLRLARQAKVSGVGKLGVRMLWERMRWELIVETNRDGGFKMNDHFHSRYIRLLIENEPDLQKMFELRKLRTA